MGIKNPNANKGKNIKPTNDLFPKSLFNYPIFCFKYMHKDYHVDKCEREEKLSLLDRICKLSTMTWEQIQFAPKHGLGTEKISQDSIKCGKPLHITPDVTFYALRFDGKKPMVGYKSDFIFHLVYLDRDFTLYNHG